MFFFGNSPAPRRNKLRSFRFFYFIKISHPPLFLLIRKGSRSRRLLICKRIRNAFGSLPTLCENAFGIVTVDFTVFFIKPLKAHTKNGDFRQKVVVSFCLLLCSLFVFISSLESPFPKNSEKRRVKIKVALLCKALIMLLCKTSYTCNSERTIVPFRHAITLPIGRLIFLTGLFTQNRG